MSTTSTTTTATELNVLIVGLGLAGIAVVQGLSKSLPKTHRLVVITEKEFGYWPIGSLRGAVIPGWEDKVAVPLDSVFPSGSRHILLSGTQVLKLSSNSVTVDKLNEGFSNEIAFDFIVIATGSNNTFPSRPLVGDITAEDVKVTLLSFQADVAASTSILCVGGGATGIEFAGEVATQFGSAKKVTLVHSGDALLTPDFNVRVAKNLDNHLVDLGVKTIYGSRVDTTGLKTGRIEKQSFVLKDGTSIEADFLFIAYGNSPNSSIVAQFSNELVNEGGFVKVKPTLQLVSKDNSLDHFYAIGDVNDIAETKLAYNAGEQSKIVIANILAAVSSSPVKSTYTANKPTIFVTVGSGKGTGQLFGLVLYSWFVTMMKSKDLLTPKFRASFGKV